MIDDILYPIIYLIGLTVVAFVLIFGLPLLLWIVAG